MCVSRAGGSTQKFPPFVCSDLLDSASCDAPGPRLLETSGMKRSHGDNRRQVATTTTGVIDVPAFYCLLAMLRCLSYYPSPRALIHHPAAQSGHIPC